ncbi:hypothetical protein DPMN_194587 [Dreissena polymorpha]|uniref:Uncharacterized protein n=1 Tax=Dreissena polymorpha TaxID=45954 RepID=A0A9D3Y4C5_DREPO|nr:hypothetical protein DPMN_194587 [Dreissena polymorpha]
MIGQNLITAPPTGGHVFQRIGTNQDIIKTNILTNFELSRDFIGTKLLTQFHEDGTINQMLMDGRTYDGQRPVTKAQLSNQGEGSGGQGAAPFDLGLAGALLHKNALGHNVAKVIDQGSTLRHVRQTLSRVYSVGGLCDGWTGVLEGILGCDGGYSVRGMGDVLGKNRSSIFFLKVKGLSFSITKEGGCGGVGVGTGDGLGKNMAPYTKVPDGRKAGRTTPKQHPFASGGG